MKNTQSNPGRPSYKPVIPRTQFTMNDLCEANGVNLKTGKGKLCSRLTLVKWVAKQLDNRRSGLITRVKDKKREPNSNDGLGRKAFVYARRPGTKSPTPTKTVTATAKPAKTAKANVSVKMNTTEEYEATKAALIGSDLTVVSVTPADTAPTPAPAVEMEPEAQAAETVEQAEVAAEQVPQPAGV